MMNLETVGQQDLQQQQVQVQTPQQTQTQAQPTLKRTIMKINREEELPREDGTVEIGPLKLRNVGTGDTQSMANVDPTLLFLRKKIYAQSGKAKGQKEPKGKYQAMTQDAKNKTFKQYEQQLQPYNRAALTMYYQPTLKSLADGVSQAYNTFKSQLGGVKPDSLIFLTRLQDPQTGVFRPFSKKTAPQVFQMTLQEMQKNQPKNFAAVRVLLSWNRFVRSVTNFLRWANFNDNMIKRAKKRAEIRAGAPAPTKLLQMIQRKQKKLTLKGLNLNDAVAKIKASRDTAITNFGNKINTANTDLNNAVDITNQIQDIEEENANQ